MSQKKEDIVAYPGGFSLPDQQQQPEPASRPKEVKEKKEPKRESGHENPHYPDPSEGC